MALIIIALLFLCGTASAATFVTPTANHADVSSIVGNAQAGDTVIITNGTVTWPSGITVTKAISIIGSGTNAGGTVITMSGNPAWTISPQTVGVTRISNMRINARDAVVGGSGDYVIGMNGPVTYRVDHVWIKNGFQQIRTGYRAYGVVDHSTFEDPQMAWRIQAPNGDYGWNSWQLGQGPPGTTNTCVFEDNYIFCTSVFNSSKRGYEVIYHQWGGRSTIRFNRIDFQAYTASDTPNTTGCFPCRENQEFIDCHGNQNYNLPVQENAAVLVEVYSNTCIAYGTGQFCNQRGGMGIWFGNTFSNVLHNTAAIINLVEEESWSRSKFPTLDTSYPCQEMVTNTFIWSNTKDGVATSPVVGWTTCCGSQGVGTGDELVIFDGTGGAHAGQAAYWREPPSASNGKPTGTYASYVPLVYPHPLVSGTPIDTNVPSMQLTPTSIDFGILFTNTSVTNTFSITNVGAGSLIGTSSVSPPFYIVGSSNYSLAHNIGTNISVRYSPTAGAFNTNTVTFTGTNAQNAIVRGAGVIVNESLDGFVVSWAATNGTIAYPFTNNADVLSQGFTQTSPSGGGIAIYGFKLTNEFSINTITISNLCSAAAGDSDSIFVSIDRLPVDNNDIWDAGATSGFVQKAVKLRAGEAMNFPTSGRSLTCAPFAPIPGLTTFCLTNRSFADVQPVPHYLVVRGRENNMRMKQWYITFQDFCLPTGPYVIPSVYNPFSSAN